MKKSVRFGTNHVVFTPITSAINLMRYFHYSKLLKAILWFNLLSGVEPLACQNGGACKMRVSNKMKVNIGRKGGHSCRFSESHSLLQRTCVDVHVEETYRRVL